MFECWTNKFTKMDYTTDPFLHISHTISSVKPNFQTEFLETAANRFFYLAQPSPMISS